ncbi:hypothetical protein [Ruegeria arenilitoris]|uniref:hypothetical protein n=1 Tax=Ruegeria arenilitoris TaxID=1173585 RepID=UPI00147DF20D|nr:hypothetical protein [Ruegeria arenilitoris]
MTAMKGLDIKDLIRSIGAVEANPKLQRMIALRVLSEEFTRRAILPFGASAKDH